MSEFTKTLIVDADSVIEGIYTDIATAITALSSTGGRIIVERAEDPYTISSSLTPVSNMEIIGNGGVKIIMTDDVDPAFYLNSVDRVTITGFEIEMSYSSFSGSAISLSGSTNCRFEDLTIYSTGANASVHNGINFTTSGSVTSNYNIIRNCHISRFEIGIRMYEGMYNIIDGCIFDEYGELSEKTKYGVSILRTTTGKGHNIVTNCITNIKGGVYSSYPDSGIFIEKSDYNIVLGNIAANGNNIGIHVKSSEGTVIGGNVCDSNDGDGIRLAGESDDLTKYSAVTGNVLSHNGNYSQENNITVKNYSQHNCLAGNVCDHGSGYGIKTETDSGFTLIDGNICYASGYGELQSNSTDDVITCNIQD